MKLYYTPGACSLAVRIIINELDLTCEYEAVNLKDKKTSSGNDFFAVNAKGSVPTLVLDNHQVLTENAVIQQYLAESAHNTALLPALGDFKRYRVLEWLNYMSTDLHKSCSPLFNPTVPAEVKASVFKPILASKLAYLDKALTGHTYLLGKEFTLPDAYLFVVLRWMPGLGIELKDYPQLTRFFEEMKKRPAVVKSLAEE